MNVHIFFQKEKSGEQEAAVQFVWDVRARVCEALLRLRVRGAESAADVGEQRWMALGTRWPHRVARMQRFKSTTKLVGG